MHAWRVEKFWFESLSGRFPWKT